MASAQICRFQRRISSLHAHHELSIKRHSDANQSYLTQNKEVMKALLSSLTDDDKKFKKSKRICRSKAVQQPASKSARVGDLTSPSCGAFSQSGSQVESNDSELFSGKLQMNVNLKRPGVNEPNRNRRSSSRPYAHNEPIFPPPTYAEPVGSPCNIFPKSNSLRPHFNDNTFSYSIGGVNGQAHTPAYHGYTSCCQTSGFPSVSFEHHTGSTLPVPSFPQPLDCHYVSHSVTDSDHATVDHDRFYTYPTADSYESCPTVPCNGNFWESAFCSKNRSRFPRLPSPRHTEINPILAFTYPTTSGHRADGFWKSNSFPQPHSNSVFPQQGLVPSDRYDFPIGEPSDNLFSHPSEYG